MCDIYKNIKDIAFSPDISDDEKADLIKEELDKEILVDYLETKDWGISHEDLNLPEDWDDSEYRMELEDIDFLDDGNEKFYVPSSGALNNDNNQTVPARVGRRKTVTLYKTEP